MKNTLVAIVLSLITNSALANDILVHKSEHYNFFRNETGIPIEEQSLSFTKLGGNSQPQLEGFFLYAENFSGNPEYNPSVVDASMNLSGLYGITGRLHQQYIDMGEHGVLTTALQDDNYFTDREFDSYWLVDRDEGMFDMIHFIEEPTENYGISESDILPRGLPSHQEEHAMASFGDNMSGTFFMYDGFDQVNRPIAYIVTDDINSIQCNFFIGGDMVGGGSLLSDNGIVSSYSTLAKGDNVTFDMNPVPEPTTMCLLALPSLYLLKNKRK